MFKPDNLFTPEQIFKEATEIQSFLELEMIPEGSALVERSTFLSNYMSRTGKMYADAKYHKDTLLNSQIIVTLKSAMSEQMSASTLNKFIDSACKDFNYLVDWCERLNRSCTHELDLMRSLISKEKAEMQFNR